MCKLTKTSAYCWDRRLFRDTFRQLRLIGLVGLVLLCLSTAICAIGAELEMQASATVRAIKPIEMHPFLLACFVVLAPVLVLYGFQFLNKRTASDLYHSLPVRRSALFGSVFSAAMAWVAIDAVLSTLLSAGLFHLFGDRFLIDHSGLLLLLFNCLAGSVFVGAAVALAMSLTGTLFTNLAVSVLIIFGPRLLLTVFIQELYTLLPILSADHLLAPFDASYNVVTNLVFGVFTGGYSKTWTFLPGGIYTLCLGLLYMLGAGVAFTRRRSEIAGKPAPNAALQTVYRLGVPLLICLIPTQEHLNGALAGHSVDGFSCVVIYLIAIVVYLLYELFTTRSWRRMVRALPGLGILLLLNGAFAGGIAVAYTGVLHTQPAAESIQSVQFLASGYFDYFKAQNARICYTDEDIRELVADQLASDIRRIQEEDAYPYGGGSYVTQEVAIRLQGRTVYRVLRFPEADYAWLLEQWEQNPEHQRLYTQLPADALPSIDGLTTKQAGEVYALLREEVAAMPHPSLFRYLQSYGNSSYGHNTYYEDVEKYKRLTDEVVADLYFTGTANGERYTGNIPLSSWCPKATNAFLRFRNENAALSPETVAQTLADGNLAAYDVIALYTFGFADGIGSGHIEEENLPLVQEELQQLGEQLLPLATEPPTIEKPLYQIVFYPYNGNYAASPVYINAPADSLPDLFSRIGQVLTETDDTTQTTTTRIQSE